MEAKVIQIGNSRGIRLPKRLITKYHLSETIVLEEVNDGILIRNSDDKKLSWDETYKAMSGADEDWSEWESPDLDDVNED